MLLKTNKPSLTRYVCALILIFIFFATTAHAVTSELFPSGINIIYNGGFYQADVSINTALVGTAYSTVFSNAVNDWNSGSSTTGREVSFSTTILSPNIAVSQSYDDSFYGQYSPQSTSNTSYHRATSFELRINTRTLSSQSSSVKQSVIAHEIGHAFALYDLSSGEYLMSHARTRSSITGPGYFDFTDVGYFWEAY